MSKLKYKDIKFQGKSLETIERVNSIVTEYSDKAMNSLCVKYITSL